MRETLGDLIQQNIVIQAPLKLPKMKKIELPKLKKVEL